MDELVKGVYLLAMAFAPALFWFSAVRVVFFILTGE